MDAARAASSPSESRRIPPRRPAPRYPSPVLADLAFPAGVILVLLALAVALIDAAWHRGRGDPSRLSRALIRVALVVTIALTVWALAGAFVSEGEYEDETEQVAAE